jgi:hypothetical protein
MFLVLEVVMLLTLSDLGLAASEELLASVL